MRLALAIIAVLLIPFNSGICELIHPANINDWWMLRLDIYAVIFMLLFITCHLKNNENIEKYFNFTIYVGVGLTSSDVIDRWCLNINWFTWTDVLMVLSVLIFGYRKYLWNSFQKKI